MKHEDYAEGIYALVDGLLTPEEEEEIREHLSSCESCSALHDSLVADDLALKAGLDALVMSEGFEAKVLESAKRLEENEREGRLRFSITGFVLSRRFAYVAVALVLIAALLTVGASYLQERSSRFGRIAKLNGLAWCKRGNSQFILSSGAMIRIGDELSTENDTRIHLLTTDNHVIALNSNTQIIIGENDRGRQRIRLIEGEIFIDATDGRRKYAVQTPCSEIRNVGTRFDVRVMPEQLIPSVVHVAVESGKAVVDIKGGSIDVKPLEKVILVEDRLAKIEKELSLEQIVKWRWNLRDLLVKPPKRLWREEDPFTGRMWTVSRRRFAMPEDPEAEEYDVILKLLLSLRQKLGRIVEATTAAFTRDYIYIGSSYGIFRYNRGPKSVSLIIPDYGIVGSDIMNITVSESGDVFDISFQRPGSDVIENLAISADSFPMILNFDPLTLEPVSSAR